METQTNVQAWLFKLMKDRQYNGQMKKDKRTKNYLNKTTQKTKDRATRTPQKPGVNSGATCLSFISYS